MVPWTGGGVEQEVDPVDSLRGGEGDGPLDGVEERGARVEAPQVQDARVGVNNWKGLQVECYNPKL